MALTQTGLPGSIKAPDMAAIMALAGDRYTVAGTDDMRVTAVAGYRRVSIAPGASYAPFMRVVNTSAVTKDFSAPSSGYAWHLVVLRRSYQAASVSSALSFETILSTHTEATNPKTLPAATRTEPGVVDDQPLAWVRVEATSTAVVVVDARLLPLGQRAAMGRYRVQTATALDTITGVRDGDQAWVDEGASPRFIGLHEYRSGAWRVHDTGWVTLGLKGGYAVRNLAPAARRSGDAVFLRGRMDRTAGNSTAFTVDSDMVPGAGIANWRLFPGGTGNPQDCVIDNGGNFIVGSGAFQDIGLASVSWLVGG